MNRRLARFALAVLLFSASGGGVSAEDEGDPADESPLETRLYEARALARGATLYARDQAPFAPGVDGPGADYVANFGPESEERIKPLGSLGDIVDRITSSVGTPGAWVRPGSYVTPSGERLLYARAGRTEQDAIAEFLSSEARWALTTTVVDIALVVGEARVHRSEGGIAAALAAGRATLLAVARTQTQSGGCGVARDGVQRAVLSDVDVAVAEGAQVADPSITIASDGIACEVETLAASSQRLTVRLRGWWAAAPDLRAFRTTEGDDLEVAAAAERRFEETVELTGGAWAWLPQSRGVTLGVRAVARSPSVPAADMAGQTVARSAAVPVGPLLVRTIDIAPLGHPVFHGRGESLAILPSNYTPPLPPEVAESAPLFPADTLVDMIKSADGAPWEAEDTSLEFVGNRLWVRHDQARIDAVHHVVDDLRATYVRTTGVRASILTLPLVALPELWTAFDDSLAQDGGAALLSRPGARLVDTVGLRLRDGQRLAAVSGTRRQYVGDFDVEVAVKSVIGNPIVKSVLDGTSLDVWAAPLGRGAELSVDLQLQRGSVREMRQVTSRHGPIQCPVYDVVRCMGTFTLPSGSTRIVGASSSGGDVTLVLLTATRE
jgi:hypothetical protein